MPKWAFVTLVLLGLLIARLLSWKPGWPAASRQQLGRLLVFQNQLVVETTQQTISYPLDATTRIRLNYQGYRGESLGGRQRASGIHNFIQLNDGPNYAFEVPSELTEARLRTVLRRWYERRVQLKEYRWGSRTILLYKDSGYEQLQEFKREFGISLYP